MQDPDGQGMGCQGRVVGGKHLRCARPFRSMLVWHRASDESYRVQALRLGGGEVRNRRGVNSQDVLSAASEQPMSVIRSRLCRMQACQGKRGGGGEGNCENNSYRTTVHMQATVQVQAYRLSL